MDRRTALKALAATFGGLSLPGFIRASEDTDTGQFSFSNDSRYGWHRDDASLRDFIRRNRYPYVTQADAAIKDTGKGKKAFLHLAFERITGKSFVPHDQGAPDCVSHAAALGVDFLAAVQIVTKRAPQRFYEEAATEPIYGGSRVEIGRLGPREGGGSTGHWAAEWLSKYGTLHRKSYPGNFDFTRYDAKKAVEMGSTGCPDPLEPIARLHPVKKTAICTSYSTLCDLIYNGSPVMVCSNVGFGNGKCRRDSQGFLTRSRKPWNHAMLFGAYDDEFERPGALCFNSWGEDWIFGPTRGPQPAGTFWVDANTVDAMLRQGDSFAFSAYVGFPRVIVPPYVLH